jgi:hypothetical protein
MIKSDLQTGAKFGMQTLDSHLTQLYREGLIAYEELITKSQDPDSIVQKLKEEGLLDKLPEKICIGQGYRGKTGKIGVGNCTSHFEFCVKGCPPVESQIYEELKKYILG